MKKENILSKGDNSLQKLFCFQEQIMNGFAIWKHRKEL